MNRITQGQGICFCLSILVFTPSCGIKPPLSQIPGETSPAIETLANESSPPVQHLVDAFSEYCWITYTPSTFDPTVNPRHWPSRGEVESDLKILRDFGIKGLVTYRADYFDRAQPGTRLNLPELAEKAGFEGLVIGMWNPLSESELDAVKTMENHPLVQGFVVGNEGLDKRYDWNTLEKTIVSLQQRTLKPVTTTEELPDYITNDRLRQLGDWVFPNAHPYFARAKEPAMAVEWTERWFQRLDSLTTLPVVFKEVGLPTSGDPVVSEQDQADYYQALGQSSVPFVFFTAFDLPWKRSTAQGAQTLGQNPEPHWGLFQNDRSPKRAADHLKGELCLEPRPTLRPSLLSTLQSSEK